MFSRKSLIQAFSEMGQGFRKKTYTLRPKAFIDLSIGER
jgi:hypothetical protein